MPADATGQPKRRRNPRGEGKRLERELIEAASALIAEAGNTDAASLRAVARRAGVSAPSVYLHFTDREALVQAVIAQRFSDLAEAVVAGIHSAGGDAGPDERLVAGCRAYVAFGLGHPGHYRALFGVPIGVMTPDAEAASRRAIGLLVQAIADCQDAGTAKPGDPFALAATTWAALHGIVILRVLSPGFPWPDTDRMVLDVITGIVGVPHH